MKIGVESLRCTNIPASNEFAEKIEICIQRSERSGRPFFAVILQIANFDVFANRRPPHVARQLLVEIGNSIRKAVHPSQFVGQFQYGVGLVFDAVDSGQVDNIAQKLTILTQNAIRSGKYNDLSSRWTDIVYQFLHPNNPGILFPTVGWAVYPRDGENSKTMIRRCLIHLQERERNK